MNRAERWLLNLMQRRCSHPSDHVTADILDGDFHGGPGGEQAVEWCLTCGAYRRVFDQWGKRPRCGDWHEPHPQWAVEGTA